MMALHTDESQETNPAMAVIPTKVGMTAIAGLIS
jgi:hypothetical protein